MHSAAGRRADPELAGSEPVLLGEVVEFVPIEWGF